MTEYVRIPTDQMDIFGDIVNRFGMPEPQDQNSDELIGPYMAGCRDGFVKYHADHVSWSWVSGRPIFSDNADIEGVTEENRESFMQIFDEVRERPPTVSPDNKSKVTRGRPFICNNWRFVWAFVPELKRWELAPLGRA